MRCSSFTITRTKGLPMTSVSESADGVKCVEFAEVIKIDEGTVRQHVEEVVRQSVEETLNGLLEAEADGRIKGTGAYTGKPDRIGLVTFPFCGDDHHRCELQDCVVCRGKPAILG
jgi:hypothetical protein